MDQDDIEFSDYEEPNVTSISFEDELNRFYREQDEFPNFFSNPTVEQLMNMTESNNDIFHEDFNMINYESIYNLVRILNVIDPMEDILNDNFDTYQDENLVKTDRNIEISSNEFANLEEDIKEKNKDCSICISDFADDSMVSITNCNHVFHTDCIKEWYKYKTDCPICREKIE